MVRGEEDMKERGKRDGTKIGIDGKIPQDEETWRGAMLWNPKQEKVSHAFEHLIQNLKAYNGVKI